ncbi:MAG: hypothetical protein JXR60_03850 [Bacteroidales bacterium]|nr:hypothetical protein [Bacteroidales bacterium]
MNKYLLLPLTVLIIAIIYSFTTKKTQVELNSITSEIQKLNRDYLMIPDTGHVNSNIEVLEISDELKYKIKKQIDLSYSKRTVNEVGDRVGVFKDCTCGDYDELVIYMDCEDDDNPTTRKKGWTGGSYVTSNKNVILKFCIIDDLDDMNIFRRTEYDYATLMIDWDGGISDLVIRLFDNENDGNINYVSLNGEEITGWYGSNNYFGENTRLVFSFFPKTSYSPHSLPYIGFNYGILGRFGSKQGYIYFDDEDDDADFWDFEYGNENWLLYDIDPETEETNELVSGVTNIISGGSNTLIYISSSDVCTYP